jgi:hypothetical protein
MSNRAVLLASAYTSSLELAVQNNFSSVAFPSISTGIFQYPKDEAAATAARAILSFLQKHKDIKRLSSVDMCILDPSNVVLWSSALKALLQGPALPPPPLIEELKKHMGVVLYRIRRKDTDSSMRMEVLLAHIGKQLVPVCAPPLKEDDGGTGANRAQTFALEALRKTSGDLMSSQGLEHVRTSVFGKPPVNCSSHSQWLVSSDDNSSLSQDASQICASYTALRKRSDHEFKAAAFHWIDLGALTDPKFHAFPKVSRQMLDNTSPAAKQATEFHPVLKNPSLIGQLNALFQLGSKKLELEESLQKDTILQKLDSNIEAAKSELPLLRKHVEQLSIETDPVPPLESMPEPQDIVTISQPPGEKLTSGQRQPVRFRKVNIPERNQRFSAYVQSRAEGFRNTARSFHGTPTLTAAASIARNGPDMKRAGSNIGTAFGAGFYTDTDPAYPEGVAGQGSVCVCTVAPGKYTKQGNSSTTAASLAAQGYDSVAPNAWHVLFHPDAVRVDYIVDYSFTGDEEAEKRMAQQKAHEIAQQQRSDLEMIRKAKLGSKQSRVNMVNAFVQRCENLVRNEKHFVVFISRTARKQGSKQMKVLFPLSSG